MSAHTPGPWNVAENGVLVYAKDGCGVALTEGFRPRVETIENAYLIAAAPELKKSLEWALLFLDRHCEAESSEDIRKYREAKTAIKKARGE